MGSPAAEPPPVCGALAPPADAAAAGPSLLFGGGPGLYRRPITQVTGGQAWFGGRVRVVSKGLVSPAVVPARP